MLAAATNTTYDLTLTWTDPNDASITGWEYQTRTESNYSGRNWTAVADSTAATTTLALAGQSRNAMQAIRIRAANALGNGPPSTEALLVPARPTGLAAAAENGRAVLQWRNPGDAAITGWQHRHKEAGGSYGNWTAIAGSDGATTAHTVRNLTNRTTYMFQVRALSRAGGGLASAEASATPAPVPAQPTGLALSLAANGSNYDLTLTWTDPNDAAITGWEYQTRAGGTYGNDWTAVAGSTAATTSLTLSRQDRNALQGIRIRAANSVGASAPSNEARLLPAVPASMTVAARATGTDSMFLDLKWAAANNALITGWQYRMKQHARNSYVSAWMDIAGSAADTTAHTLAVPASQSGYVIKIRALNAAGDGPRFGGDRGYAAAGGADGAGGHGHGRRHDAGMDQHGCEAPGDHGLPVTGRRKSARRTTTSGGRCSIAARTPPPTR